MPNWCDNQVTITGPNSVIDKIEKIVNDESNNVENNIRSPEEIYVQAMQFFDKKNLPAKLLENNSAIARI